MSVLCRKALARKGWVFAICLSGALLLVGQPTKALASRGGGGDDSRSEFYGLVQELPASGLQGTWVIGGRTFTTDAGTEFDRTEGPLVVGTCVKVQLRNGRVHEIDSEPLRDCQ